MNYYVHKLFIFEIYFINDVFEILVSKWFCGLEQNNKF